MICGKFEMEEGIFRQSSRAFKLTKCTWGESIGRFFSFFHNAAADEEESHNRFAAVSDSY